MNAITKVFIWIGAFFACILVIMLGNFIVGLIFPGYKMGWLVDFLLTSFVMITLPKRLCNRLDIKAYEREAKKHGMTPGEYASTVFPPSLLDLCEAYKNDGGQFEKLMQESIAGEAITKPEANILRYMFFRR